MIALLWYFLGYLVTCCLPLVGDAVKVCTLHILSFCKEVDFFFFALIFAHLQTRHGKTKLLTNQLCGYF